MAIVCLDIVFVKKADLDIRKIRYSIMSFLLVKAVGLTHSLIGLIAVFIDRHDFTSGKVNNSPIVMEHSTVSMSHRPCYGQVVVDNAILASCMIIDSVHNVIPFLMVGWAISPAKSACLLQ